MGEPGFLRANTVTPLGSISVHEVTPYGLHRIRIELGLSRPDPGLWTGLVPETHKVLLWHIDEQPVGGLVMYSLWIYCKERASRKEGQYGDQTDRGSEVPVL
jgi:hypothetical protein